jgi:exodeoxyribonuclease V alpha subunit
MPVALSPGETDCVTKGLTRALPTLLGGDGKGRIRWVLPSRLRAAEAVFAITVHQSQESKCSYAALVQPERLSPVLTRERVYTSITRVRTS